ncbi:hypothetical protein F4553_005164 [Allocatelliglobosispora scoriae]|uniref:DUF6311 domain-containing protein n=1 Tax=Allocatelliglobosispora scoriae TaxID=643052 RepID=A0A841BVT1_9ACTN|nr:hypothetical protein [Allocatelliglobosispora scoriae]MBB5871785.1 hypothetical protein [Allocatelliglobosispora scoriae]
MTASESTSISDPAAVESVTGRSHRPGRFVNWLRTRPTGFRDAAAVLVIILGAVAVFGELWAGGGHRALVGNADDQMLFEWMFTHAANSVVGLDNPLLAPSLGAPTTANLMGNTSLLLLAIPLTPVTLLLGPGVSYAVTVTACLAGTAIAWYAFLRRVVGTPRDAALAGALFCGFAPGIVSQSIGHPQMAAQFLVPLLVALCLRLGEPGRTRRTGVALGLVIAAQILLGEEVLLITVLAFGTFAIAYALQRPAEVRRRLGGAAASLAIAAAVSLALVGYPLWLQFFSPYAYRTIPNGIFAADLGSYLTYATHSLAGSPRAAAAVSPNVSEQTTFFGLPLLVAGVAATVWLWRLVWLRTAAITALIFLVAALGAEPKWSKQPIGVPGPWRVFSDLPVLHDIITTRLALVATPVLGLLIAASWQAARKPRRSGRAVAWLWPTALAAAMLPTLPTVLPAVAVSPVPEFITSGDWRRCADPGGTIVAYAGRLDGLRKAQMRWQGAAGIGYASPNGYYIARAADGLGRWGQPIRRTDVLVDRVARTGVVEPITPLLVGQVRADLAYWGAHCLIVDERMPHLASIESLLTALTGVHPLHSGGIVGWDLRGR